MSELVLENNTKLPEGWIFGRLQDIVLDPKNDIVDGPFGSNLKATEYVNHGIPIIRLQNITRNHFVDKNIQYVTKEKADQLKRHSFLKNDIVITKLGFPVGKATLVPKYLENGIIIADILRMRVLDKFVSRKFLMYMINSEIMIKQFANNTQGTTRPRVNLTKFRDFFIPIPPLNEQKRIVEKIEDLFSLVDSTKQILEKTKILLKQYRLSIIKSTFEGKLVPQDPNDEPASALLEKIRDKKSSKSNIRTNLNTLELVLEKNNHSKSWINVELNNIPKTWEIVELQQIAKIIDSLHITPKYSSEGIPMVRSTEIKYGDLNLKQALRVSKEIYDDFTMNHKPERNDILMSRVGTYFVTCFVNTDEIFCMGQNTLVIHPIINSRYLYYMLNSKFVNKQIEEKLVGTSGQRTISLKNIKEFLIFVPPLNEQKKIVEKIEESISLIQNSEKRIDSLVLNTNLMKNAILKQAFEGKLVPQDPKDEPAKILLQKIKKEKEQLIQKQKVSRRSKIVK